MMDLSQLKMPSSSTFSMVLNSMPFNRAVIFAGAEKPEADTAIVFATPIFSFLVANCSIHVSS